MLSKIPNRFPALVALAFFIVAPLVGASLKFILLSAAGSLGVLVFLMYLWWSGFIGGGAAKLAAALSLWLGFTGSLLTFLLILTCIVAAWWLGAYMYQKILKQDVSRDLPFALLSLPVFAYVFAGSELCNLILAKFSAVAV
ncbi:MAG: hypothetical protein AAFY05_12235 [Pseudomonadota bacterium]